MTNAERVERRAIMCWRVIVDLNQHYPSAWSATFANALKPHGPTLDDVSPKVLDAPEVKEAIDLSRRLLKEHVIEGEVHTYGVDDAILSSATRRGLSKRDPNSSLSIIDSVESALRTIDTGGVVDAGEFTRWARECGFEP